MRGSFPALTTAWALRLNIKPKSSSHSNDCMGMIALEAVSGLQSARKSLNALEAGFGWNRKKDEARSSFLLCRKHPETIWHVMQIASLRRQEIRRHVESFHMTLL